MAFRPRVSIAYARQRLFYDHGKATDEHVFVGIYDMTDADAAELDAWEGADNGLYRKLRVRVHTLDGDKLCWVYVLDGYEGGLPSARYLGLLADAAFEAGAPDDYILALRTRPCRSVGPGSDDRREDAPGER